MTVLFLAFFFSFWSRYSRRSRLASDWRKSRRWLSFWTTAPTVSTSASKSCCRQPPSASHTSRKIWRGQVGPMPPRSWGRSRKWHINNQCWGSGSGAFLTPGSGMGRKSGSRSGMNNPDHISESLETIFWVKILKFFYAHPASGINIPGPQHC